MKEEIARVLTCTNPQPPDSLVEFNYAQGCFLPVPPAGHTVYILNVKGTTIHRDTEEAKNQMAEFGEGKNIANIPTLKYKNNNSISLNRKYYRR